MIRAKDVSLDLFEPIKINHKERIDTIRRRYGHNTSSHAFSSLYLWQDKTNIYLRDDLLCVKLKGNELNYFFPCGGTESKLEFITGVMDHEKVSFRYMQKEDVLFLKEHFPGSFSFHNTREDWEYIYDRDEQVRVEGASFKHLRGKIHRGRNARNWKVVKLSKANVNIAGEIAYRWNDENKNKGVSDIKATLYALEYFNELNLSGILLMENKKAYGFALGTAITEDTYDLHISKTLESDIDCYLKWELYRQLPDNINYINREEDLGIIGLRIHKTEMKPVRFHELYRGTMRQIDSLR